MKCRKRAPPRWKIGKDWFCGYPEVRPCNGPGPLPGHHRTKNREKDVGIDLEPEEDVNDQQLKGEGRQNSSRAILEKLSTDISRRWLGGYEGLEVVPGIVGTAVLGVSAAEMVLIYSAYSEYVKKY